MTEKYKTIAQLTRECDALAARYYKVAESDRERAARDWKNHTDYTASVVLKLKQGQKDPKWTNSRTKTTLKCGFTTPKTTLKVNKYAKTTPTTPLPI